MNYKTTVWIPPVLITAYKFNVLRCGTIRSRIKERAHYGSNKNTAVSSGWNTKDPRSGYCGFVTSFDVNTDYLQQFKAHQVGSVHREYWIPSERLDEFNHHIIGDIRIENTFYGEQYDGLKFDFQGKTEKEQIALLEQMGIG